MASVSLIFFAGGATTRCKVERRTSLLHLDNKSPTLMTIVPGYEEHVERVYGIDIKLTIGVAAM